MHETDLISIVLKNCPADAPVLAYIREIIERHIWDNDLQVVLAQGEEFCSDFNCYLEERIEGIDDPKDKFKDLVDAFVHAHRGKWSEKTCLLRTMDILELSIVYVVPSNVKKRKLYTPAIELFKNCYLRSNGSDYFEDLKAERESLDVNNILESLKGGKPTDIASRCTEGLDDCGTWWTEYGDSIWSASWDSGFPGGSGGQWIHHIHGAYISWGSDTDAEGPFVDGDVIDVLGTELLLKDGDAVEQE